ncbi:nuclear egress lamina protein [Felid alphaherpesvirus 1]|uniref:Nuclear egress lamina protein n=1 Tax=Feline herpesvirus 1 TaxID=10334 RepID=D1FXV1_FHV1|nr:nuclear egress lamina protein [Felid alphaherpesvirus 1]AMN88959.1 nuclear egress lamina protein [synthetic construct]ACT88327.1 nuclear egress lamina protein [Felid alphaherpesvirus 1]ALJ84099.1 nuclear egress lamina protein [Felid alphaherpesvirus 1]ALJ84175.1 nuclear egress lamina protein [Felid alphaherpesvirus 1]ALJ84251.1 nuclear egress lamina protein [Felid alphaherpesvirus 1]
MSEKRSDRSSHERDAEVRSALCSLLNVRQHHRKSFHHSRKNTRKDLHSTTGVRRTRGDSTTKQARLLEKTPMITCFKERERYSLYFDYVSVSPSDELAAVRDLVVPIVKTTPISLPFDLNQTVADNCVSLSAMGYHLGIGGYCPTCAVSGEPRLYHTSRAALVLAYVQQLNNIYEYRVFLASIISLANHIGGSTSTQIQGSAERFLEDVLSQPELFFVYHVLRDGGPQNFKVLFYRDLEFSGYMMYVVFPGKTVHLHHRLLDRLLSACHGYRIIAHVWQTMFILVVRRDGERQTDMEIPTVSATDIYCKMRDLSFDGELLLEYRKLYSIFDEFPPPR